MTLTGLLTRAARTVANLMPLTGTRGGWFPVIREPYTGAWQENAPPLSPEAVLAHYAVFGCVTLIATDIAKCALRLVAEDDEGIWTETTNPAYSPVLRTPNTYQTVIKFIEQWMVSKLTTGNTYVLKQRDARGVVSALYVLDPSRVQPLVAPDGAVYYRLQRDDLVGVAETADVVAPAREIIHDREPSFFHPLVGVSPLYACGLAAQHGLTMQTQSERFFRGGSQPGGILTVPPDLKQEQADKMKTDWETNFGGANAGRVALIPLGLKYEPLGAVSAADSQLIQQLQMTAQQVATCFHVPLALLGLNEGAVGDLEALFQQYHAQCIQTRMVNLETVLDQGLELKAPFGTEFNIDDLIWMVTATKTKAAAEAIGAGALSPDEARKKWFGLGSVAGGDTPYMQQQNFSLAALAQRDADDPFSKAATPTAAPVATPVVPPDSTAADEQKFFETLTKSLEGLTHAA